MENKKVNFFAIPVFSFVPTKYKELIKEKGGKIFGALLIAFLIMSIIDAVVLHFGFGEVKEMVSEKCPDFVLAGGELLCSEKVEIDEEGVFIKIDCDTPGISLDDFQGLIADKRLQSAIYLGSESLTMYSASNGIQQIKYADLDRAFAQSGGKGLSFSKDSLVDSVLPIIESVCMVVVILSAFIIVGFHYLVCLIYKLITSLACNILHKDIEDKEKYRLTVLARFAIVVIMWLVGQFVFIPSSTLVGIILTVAYIFVVVKLYEEDTYNDQITYYEEPSIESSDYNY